MTERVCTCGHKESEHFTMESEELACFHKIGEFEGNDQYIYCSCMQFAWDEEAFTRDTLIEANELIANLQNEIASLREDRGDLLLQVNAYNTLMPCGHLARYAVTADEGTSFCLMCEYNVDDRPK